MDELSPLDGGWHMGGAGGHTQLVSSSCHRSWGWQGPNMLPGLIWFVFLCGMSVCWFSSKTVNL